MSHAVQPNNLAEAAAPYGATPFLLYAGRNGSARANHVRVLLQSDPPIARVTGFGRGVVSAVEQGAVFSLLWPATGAEQFSLIADGSGEMADADTVIITIASAVLHRPAPGGTETSTC